MSNRNFLFRGNAASESGNKFSNPIRVFVHLAREFDADKWEKSWAEGKIIGINERMPYGYFRAAEDGCNVSYSKDKTRNKLERLISAFASSVIGVDIVHAWRNRKEIYAADVVWTHTELQSLAVLLFFEILFWKPRPKLIAQSVWLMDRWPGLGSPRRWLVSHLLAKADILTFLSPENRKAAENSFQKFAANLSPLASTRTKFLR
jgi:hypothetical protein